MKSPKISRRTLLTIVLVSAVAPYFICLGSSSLWDSNEAFYAETPRRMVETGDYINPSFNDRPRFNKPPLSYWVVASSYRLFGVSEATERLPIALGAVVLIATAFLLGRVSYNIEAGILAATAMALSPRFLMFSRRIIIDIYVAMFMGLVLLFFVLAEREGPRRKLYLALMYVSAGLGFMTKGPIAIAMPAIVFFLYLLLTRRLGKLREMMLPYGALIVLAIILPWYGAIYLEHGWVYIESFFLRDNLSRFTEPVWGPRRGFFFYIPVVLGDMFPWSLFLLPAIWVAARRTREKSLSVLRDGGNYFDKGSRTLFVLWIAVIVVFFSFSSNKEDLYILPVYTAAAALIGGFLSGYVIEFDPARRTPGRATTILLGAILLLAGAAALYLFGRSASGYEIDGAMVIGGIAVLGGAMAAGLALLKKDFHALVGTGITLIVINWVFVTRTLPDFERYKPARAFSEIIRREASPDALAGYYRLASPSMVFYLNRPVFEYYKEEEVVSAFASGREVFCIMSMQDYESIRVSLPGGSYVLASNPVFQVKLRFILESRVPPQVVLIHNRGGASSPQ